jgi:hypothetical protein
MHIRAIAAVSVVATLGLAGCSESKLEQCPAVSVLVDTSTYPMWLGSQYIYFAWIKGAKRDCDIDKFTKHVEGSVDIDFQATRTNAGPAMTYPAQYYVAITTEGRVLAKRVYTAQFNFEQGQATTQFTQSLNALSLTVGQDKRAADYGIIVGFQLTKAQLDYNRRAGRYPK